MAAVSLLAAVTLSSPMHAATFTLQELIDGQDFTVGNLRFFAFGVPEQTGDFLPQNITIETIESPMLPGFMTRGNGFLGNQNIKLRIQFSVEDLTQQVSEALLWFREFGDRGTCISAPCNSIDTILTSPTQPGFRLEAVVEQPQTEVLADFGLLPQPASEIEIEIEIEIEFEIECEPGFGCVRQLWVGGVAVQFGEDVPEPGSAELSGIVLGYCPQTQLLINDDANDQADNLASLDQCVVEFDVCQAGASSAIGSIRCVTSLYHCRARGIYQELYSDLALIRGFVMAYRRALLDARRQRVDDLFRASAIAQDCGDDVLDAIR